MTKAKESNAQRLRRERDHQKVRAIFKNLEHPGAPVKFPFRKYKEDGVQWYEFKHDQEYEIPLMVYDHINKGCFNQIESLIAGGGGIVDHRGQPATQNHITKEHRFAFVQTSVRGLRDYDDMQPVKVHVETAAV